MNDTIIINGKEYNREQAERFKQQFINVWGDIRDSIIELFHDTVKNISEVIEKMREQRKKKAIDYNWHVPIKIDIPKAPDLKLPGLFHIRSNL